MDQSLVHTFSWGNSYGPMVLKVLLKFPPSLVLVHGWLVPAVGTVFQEPIIPEPFLSVVTEFKPLLGHLPLKQHYPINLPERLKEKGRGNQKWVRSL